MTGINYLGVKLGGAVQVFLTGIKIASVAIVIGVAFFAPAGVPLEVKRALVPALERAIKSPAIGAKLKPLGIVMDYSPPEKLLEEIRDEHRRVSDLAAKSDLVN